jgi:hypothetical protein
MQSARNAFDACNVSDKKLRTHLGLGDAGRYSYNSANCEKRVLR